ncbi:unnamed protein product [Haemonchus placei]|uniref:DUF433 domain-containing protein n=1 Tax=Haemonchus placei TaxID=6290 RepID=A0A0N4WPH5_HAEPC|nr:unnamed protein product [Haemonchus placei]
MLELLYLGRDEGSQIGMPCEIKPCTGHRLVVNVSDDVPDRLPWMGGA